MSSNRNAHRRSSPAANQENGYNACVYPRNVAIGPRSGAHSNAASKLALSTLDVAIRPRSGPSRNDAGFNSALFMLDAIQEKVFPIRSDGASANKTLRNRFDQLPIHKMCYDQSDDALKKLRKAISPSKVQRLTRLCDRRFETGNRQDCFGMTPLHILSCSMKHDLAAYQLLIDKYPENLITKDGWGDVPLLYAFWGNAPQEVINLLVDKQKEMFPSHQLDWPGMVEIVGRARYLPGRAGASLSCIKNILDVKRSRFSSQRVDWQKAVTEWAAEDLFGTSDPQAPKFHHDTFKRLIAFGIAERVNSLGVAEWRKEIENDIVQLRWFAAYRLQSTKKVHSKLAHYEHLDQLREATTVLELALWKSDIDHSAPKGREERDASHVRCGADVVVPNVLSFLL